MSTRSLPEIFNLRGFDSRSKTLQWPSLAAGQCLGEFLPESSIARHDTGVAPRSGDLALIRLHAHGKPDALTVKQLEYVGHQWFMLSFDGWHEWDPRHFEVLGKIVQFVRFAWAPASKVAAATIPAGFREYQSRISRLIMPMVVQHGWDRLTSYPMRSVA